MDYQEYKEDFLNTLRADSVYSGTDTEDEFLNHTSISLWTSMSLILPK